MRRTIKVVLVYFAVVALGWVNFAQGDEPGLIETSPTSVPAMKRLNPRYLSLGPSLRLPLENPIGRRS